MSDKTELRFSFSPRAAADVLLPSEKLVQKSAIVRYGESRAGYTQLVQRGMSTSILSFRYNDLTTIIWMWDFCECNAQFFFFWQEEGWIGAKYSGEK